MQINRRVNIFHKGQILATALRNKNEDGTTLQATKNTEKDKDTVYW